MDSSMVIKGIIAFGVYILLQLVVFRLTRQSDATRWVVKLYCLVGAVLCVWSVGEPSVALGSFLVYSSVCAVYILCIFSVMEASLTLRILSEIEQAGKKGLVYRTLQSRYSRAVIVQKRLNRFLQFGDLLYRDGKYYRTDHITLFKFRESVMTICKQLFPEQ